MHSIRLSIATILLIPLLNSAGEIDPYEHYIKTSADFKPVKQEKTWCLKAFPSWTYMPWTFHWNIGYTDESGKWSIEHGYNGAFIDWGNTSANNSKTGKLDWINQFKLRFYQDHLAGKRVLHLYDGADVKAHLNALHSAGLRSPPLNEATLKTLHDLIAKNIAAVQSSPYRAAYALDDEASWGHFVHPTMWRITDDAEAYPRWLKEVYGPDAPKRDRWVTYNDFLPRLASWSVKEFDASPLLDQWSFNDSYWLNDIGELVEYANSLDPQTPVGLVGCQAPNAFGGYDYVKLMRKVQYIEAYNSGSSQAIIRSFNPHNAIPSVTSHFHRSADDDIWQMWYYLAHGNRGMIGWVDKWFDGTKAQPWHEQLAPSAREAAEKIGPLMSGAEWIHDGVALYYSHASIQLGWVLDAQAHGKTWINRNADERLGSSHLVRHAWENMLRDSGIQCNFIGYADVVQNGIPDDYKVLILPACLCLSDVEARRIEDFCKRGGTVIADYLPGVWDQHGKGRAKGGALDDLFGVKHDPEMKAADVFGGKLWCEVDQDANFSYKTYASYLTNGNTCLKDASGFNKAVRAMETKKSHALGKGQAFLFNLSPQWYNAFRTASANDAAQRSIFMAPVLAAGIKPWVSLKNAGEAEFGAEISYWSKQVEGGKTRTIVFVSFNPEVKATATGGGNAAGLKTAELSVVVQFAKPISGVRNERTGEALGTGSEFPLRWKQNEAVVLSFDGAPLR